MGEFCTRYEKSLFFVTRTFFIWKVTNICGEDIYQWKVTHVCVKPIAMSEANRQCGENIQHVKRRDKQTSVFPTRTENIRRVETKSPVFVIKIFVTWNVSHPCNENISHVKVTGFVIRIFVTWEFTGFVMRIEIFVKWEITALTTRTFQWGQQNIQTATILITTATTTTSCYYYYYYY